MNTIRPAFLAAALGITPLAAFAQYVEVTPSASGVTASTNDGNVPGNAVDNNLSTRWSGNGDGAWLQLDLGATRTVGYVRVAVFGGNARRNRFDIEVSTGAGVWTRVWTGESSGTTTQEQTYDFPDVSARWVRYLGHGSNVNAWNSVAEVSVFAAGSNPTATATATATPSSTPTATPTATPTSPTRRFTVSSIAELQSRLDSALAGDEILLRNGTYSTGAAVTVSRGGTSSARLLVRAETVGGATIGGSAGFTFSGGASYVTIQGFRFTHAAPQQVPAGSHHVRFTRNTFQLASTVKYWLETFADDGEIDHNTFQNKTTLGVYISIQGPSSDVAARRTWIHHNYFFNHSFGGANGGESIRNGVSSKALSSANTLIEWNLFDRANGDPEAISNKSSDNTVRYNTLRNSLGCIVMRHGNRTSVYGNFILNGDCGIRIYGNDHLILNNTIATTTGTAITIGSGTVQDHYAGEPADSRTGKDAADRVKVLFNTVVDAAIVVSGEDRTYAARDSVVANNILQSASGTLVSFTGDAPVGFLWQGNILWGAASNGNIPSGGYWRVDPKITRDGTGVFRLSTTSPAVDAAAGSYSQAVDDMDGQARTSPKDVGADELSTASVQRRPLTTADVGPSAP